MNVVISQPMFFPWVGMLEQVRLANIYVHYSDAQFSKGSLVNRVQIKTDKGIRWLTVPLRDLHLGQHIDEVRIDDRDDWRQRHMELLELAYDDAPYRSDMIALVRSVYSNNYQTIGRLSEDSLLALCRYFGLDADRRFIAVSTIGIDGSGSGRVLGVVRALGGDRYVTGWGARNYLDHQLFEQSGVQVEYMNYQKMVYPQQHGKFTPFVSALDLVANVGPDGKRMICSGTVPWREFVSHERD